MLQDKQNSKDQDFATLNIEILLTKFRSLLLRYSAWSFGDLDEAEDWVQEALLLLYAKFSPALSYSQMQDLLRQNFWEQVCLPTPNHIQERLFLEDSLNSLEESLLKKKSVAEALQQDYVDQEEYYQIAAHVEFCWRVKLQIFSPQQRQLFLLAVCFKISVSQLAEHFLLKEDEILSLIAEVKKRLADIFQNQCSLIKVEAPCRQCHLFGEWLNGVEVNEQQEKALPFLKQASGEENLKKRIALLEEQDLARSLSKRFHRKLFTLLK